MGFIRQSHGFVGIKSEPGKGTTVRLLLPPAQQGQDFGKAPPVKKVADSRPGKTLLVVEDEDGVRGFVVSVLEKAGYRVLAASGAKEALTLSAEYDGTIDLLISDIIMPDVRGDELAHMLKKLRPGLRVLLITGYAEEGSHREELLRKPFTTEDLLARVRSLTGRQRTGRKRKPIV